MGMRNKKDKQNQIFLWESSTATLNAPNNAVSCIFSEPPNDSRCLFFSAVSVHSI